MGWNRSVVIVRRWLPAIVLGLGVVGALLSHADSAVAADVVPSARIEIEDAPFTRNRVVDLVVVPDPETLVVVSEVRVANEPTVVDGLLVGTSTTQRTRWTLADGPDGVRTVYAQLRFASGSWSPVTSAEIVLDQSPSSSIAFDLADGMFHDATTSAPEPDWHERSATPEDRIYARGLHWAGVIKGFIVADADWTVSLSHNGGPLGTGRLELSPVIYDGSCAESCLTVQNRMDGCAGAGWIDIVDIAFTPERDLERLDADYRFRCGEGEMIAGSVRYGSSREVIALDHAPERFELGEAVVDEAPVDDTVTFTNIGTAENTFGQATIEGSEAADFAIVEDRCSGMTIGVQESCAVTVRFAPSSHGQRVARLRLSDETPRGERSVRIIGYGYLRVGLDLTVEPPADGPGRASVVVTMTPAVANGAVLLVDGVQRLGPTEVVSADPSRRQHRYEVALTPGRHTFEARYQSWGFFIFPEPRTTEIELADSGRPWGFMQVGNGLTATAPNTVVAAITTLPLPIHSIALSNDGVTWTERSPSIHQHSWVLSPGDGLKTVYLKWHDGSTDTWSPIQTATITLDATLPTATAPAQTIGTGAMAAGTTPTRLHWTGAVFSGELSAYDLQQSTDGGPFVEVWSGLSTNLSRNLPTGHSYRFRVRARDTGGNVGAWAYGPSFRLTGVSQASSAVRYAGTWATSTSTTWWGGTARSSSRAGSTASYTFTGKSIAWVGLKGVGRGKATVYVNGAYKATIDLYSATTKKQLVVWSANYSTSATRTVTIKVLGTSGRPRVDVDGFIVGS